MQEEIYVPIKDFETYHVSNLGNVKNNKTGKILKQVINGRGYYDVGLYVNGKKHSKVVHRLVANAFLENLDNKKCVDHIDNDKQNNNINNLRYATIQENKRNSNIGKNNTSGIKGTHFNKKSNKWESYIKIDGIKTHLGFYKTIEEAK